MPIVGVELSNNKSYIVTVMLSNDTMKTVKITNDGLYSIWFIQKDGMKTNRTGKITRIETNENIANSSYIVFDPSSDKTNKKERIYFNQIQSIRDVTPDNAYAIALKHGFKGTELQWLKSLEGKSTYQIALKHGFKGTEAEWLEAMKEELAEKIMPRWITELQSTT